MHIVCIIDISVDNLLMPVSKGFKLKLDQYSFYSLIKIGTFVFTVRMFQVPSLCDFCTLKEKKVMKGSRFRVRGGFGLKIWIEVFTSNSKELSGLRVGPTISLICGGWVGWVKASFFNFSFLILSS